MGCRANVEIAGKRVWEIFPDPTNRVGLNVDDRPIFTGRNRSDLYDLTSESPNNANGDLTSKTDSSGTTTYEYDALGNLRKVTPPTGSVIEYVIDGANRRVGKKVGGTLRTRWIYSGTLRIVGEVDAGGVATQYVYGTRPNVAEYVIRGGETYRVVVDYLGSVRKIVKSGDGSVVQTMEYDDFGNLLVDTAASGWAKVPFGFAGGLYDRDTGLVRFGARDFDARSGTWTVKDPAGFAGGLALFSYCGDDPVNYVDVDGRHPGLIVVVAIAAALAIDAESSDYWADSHGPDPMFAALGPELAAEYAFVAVPAIAADREDVCRALTGSKEMQLPDIGGPRNVATTLLGRTFSGHALDQMQNRGIIPTVVDNAIRNGAPFSGNTPNTIGYHDAVNNVSVILNSVTGNVVTVRYGPP